MVCKPKYSMTTLGSRAAPDCCTGQSKGRYCGRAHVQSQSLSLVTVICPGYYCITFLETPHLLVKFIMWRLRFCYFQILAMLPQVLFTMCCAFFFVNQNLWKIKDRKDATTAILQVCNKIVFTLRILTPTVLCNFWKERLEWQKQGPLGNQDISFSWYYIVVV